MSYCAALAWLCVLAAALDPSAAAGQAQLSCTGATTNTDNSAVKTPLQYTWYHGTSPGSYPDKASGLQSCGYTWPSLGAGTHYFVATNTDSLGRESQYSAMVQWQGGSGQPVAPNPPSGVAVAQQLAFELQTPRNATLAVEVGKVGAQVAWSTAVYFRSAQSPAGLYCMVPRDSVTFLAGHSSEAVFVKCGA